MAAYGLLDEVIAGKQLLYLWVFQQQTGLLVLACHRVLRYALLVVIVVLLDGLGK